MDIIGIIPSRYGSTRFPGKPLVEIDGKSMIQRVYEQASLASSLTELIVATDDQRIYEHVLGFSGNVMMTSNSHENGTERCAEVMEKMSDSFQAVINIQGDEPFLQPEHIDLVANSLQNEEGIIVTLIKKISSYEELLSNTVKKVVINNQNEALYFSRSPIPYFNKLDKELVFSEFNFYKHIGIYGFEKETLLELVKLPVSPLEQLESLEQLRWLQNGYKITVKETEQESISIDTPEDLKQIMS